MLATCATPAPPRTCSARDGRVAFFDFGMLRRLLFQAITTIRARAPWGPLMRELVEGAAPTGELGAEHARWLSRADLSRA